MWDRLESRSHIRFQQADRDESTEEPGYGCGVTFSFGQSIKSGVIIEDNVFIGLSSLIDKGATIGAGSILGNNVTVKKDAVVTPGTIVPDGCTYNKNDTIDCP